MARQPKAAAAPLAPRQQLAAVSPTGSRPMPPSEVVTMAEASRQIFAPAIDLVEWVRAQLLDERGALFNPQHGHLRGATIGALWTNVEYLRQQRRIVGQAEMPAFMAGGWKRARQEAQMVEWFGQMPDFVLTFDALYAEACEDAAFCALVEHELYHCAQALDSFGMPKFNQSTGLPVWAIRGHDVEEFVGVVQRYGIQVAGESAVDMVIAAAATPTVAPVAISQACGTCLARAA